MWEAVNPCTRHSLMDLIGGTELRAIERQLAAQSWSDTNAYAEQKP